MTLDTYDIQMFCKGQTKLLIYSSEVLIIMNNEWLYKYVFLYILVSPVILHKTPMQMLSDSFL